MTFILDEIPDGELADSAYVPSSKTPLEYLQIICHLNKGLIFAQENGMVDVDYKLENIFMDGLTPKMGDFGYAFKEGERLSEMVGSPGYLSPEI